MYKYIGKLDDETFVGNTNTRGDHSYLINVDYRLGDIALDINDNELDPKYMKPLFVKNHSLTNYNNIMEQRMKDIRSGKLKL